MMAARIVRDEIHRRMTVGPAGDSGAVDAFRAPKLDERIAEAVLAQSSGKAHRCSLAGRGDRRVGGVAAEPLEPARFARRGLVELDHWLAEADEIGCGGNWHGHWLRDVDWIVFPIEDGPG